MFVIQPTFETVFFFFSKIRSFYMLFWGFPDSSVGKESAYNEGHRFNSWDWEDPMEKG